jgi:hypothetical protein
MRVGDMKSTMNNNEITYIQENADLKIIEMKMIQGQTQRSSMIYNF